VEFFRVFDGRLKTLALLRQHVDHHRLVAVLANSRVPIRSGRLCPSMGPSSGGHFLEDEARSVATAASASRGVGGLQGDLVQRPFEALLRLVGQLEGDIPGGSRRMKRTSPC